MSDKRVAPVVDGNKFIPTTSKRLNGPAYVAPGSRLVESDGEDRRIYFLPQEVVNDLNFRTLDVQLQKIEMSLRVFLQETVQTAAGRLKVLLSPL